jgi:stage V sporulation protein B
VRKLVVIAVPITLAASIMPIVLMLDTMIVTNVLSTIDYSAFNPLEPVTSFGVLTGAVNPLVNMPAVLSLALCMSLVPAISEARAKRDMTAVGNRSAMGFKLAVLIGLPCAVGMYLLAEPIITLLYSHGGLSPEEVLVGAGLLKIMAIAVLFLTMLQTMSGILQGAGRQFIPLFTLLIGAAVKVVLSLTLIRMPELNIDGAAISTAACYGIAAILNVIAVIKITKPNIKVVSGLLMPIISSGVMGIVTYLMYKTILPSLGNTKATLLSIVGAFIVYIVMLFITGGIQKDDMAFIPGGRGITRFMNKLGFWGD